MSSKAAASAGTRLDVRVKSSAQTTLVRWEDVPHWQQDNHYIHGSYRRPSGSYLGSFTSLGQFHNETVNIYSHLVPALIALPIAIVLSQLDLVDDPSTSWIEIAALGAFVIGLTAALGMSATYHTISNHSPTVNRWGNQLDYVGIVLLIAGSFVPSIYYGFWCDPHLIFAYLTMIVLLGAACATVSLNPRFRTPAWRPFRAGLFVSMGLSAVFPVVHGLLLYGMERMRKQIGLVWLSSQGLAYVLGAIIYAARVPERWFPGKFDVWGSSHQIFHFLVVLAATLHLVGIFKAFGYRHGASDGANCS